MIQNSALKNNHQEKIKNSTDSNTNHLPKKKISVFSSQQNTHKGSRGPLIESKKSKMSAFSQLNRNK
jgi:hypothetical protein